MYKFHSRRAFLATALLGFSCLLTLAGCGGSNPQVIYDGGFMGIQGQATRGPLSPTTQQGQANTAPLSGVVVTILTPDGKEQARQTTDKQGNYKIGLPSGIYTVQGLAPSGSQGFPAPPAPQTVTLRMYETLTVNLAYDTGIR